MLSRPGPYGEATRSHVDLCNHTLAASAAHKQISQTYAQPDMIVHTMDGSIALEIYCRGGVTADAIGWIKMGPMDEGGSGGGMARCRTTHEMKERTGVYPGSEPS